jgi:hypothetical protein
MRGDHNDLIIELPKFVPESFCRHLIDKFEKDEKAPGVVTYENVVKVIPELKNSIESGCLCCKPGWEDEFNEVSKFVRHAYELYIHQLYNEYDYKQIKHTFHNILKQSFDHMTPGLQKQPKGGRYGWHYDQIKNEDPKVDCFIMLMIYLNTLEPDEGGCTEFGHGRKIRPECGKVVIWPATWAYPHCGNEVKCDGKYTIVTPIYLRSS